MEPRDGKTAPPSRNVWHYFPWFIAAAMGVVIAVNSFMAYSALSTFPGNAGGDGFVLSNNYNAILARVKQEAALGWAVQAEVDKAGHPVVVLTDRSGNVLAGATIEATAQRPLGDQHTTPVRFSEVSPGRYLGGAALDAKGQWDLEFSATAGGHEFSTTRRLVVR
jgi:nitrogen fixation protein FixH